MAAAPATRICNAISIDVEDYFHVAAFRRVIQPQEWDLWPSRVAGNVYRILDWLDGRGIRATFFVLGWVARRQPALVRAIQDRGHEIASHGFSHQLVYEIGPDSFREDVRAGKKTLEDLCGVAVQGYRAPSYSIVERSLWALDILVEEGFTYDSSIFPIRHDIYGMPDAERFPHTLRRTAGWLREFPISTREFTFGKRKIRVPVGGGGYLRLFPVSLVYRAMAQINGREKQPAILYFHPWEIDPGQPRVRAGLKSRFRHYVNLGRTFGKLDYLARRLPFAPVAEVLADVLPSPIDASSSPGTGRERRYPGEQPLPA